MAFESRWWINSCREFVLFYDIKFLERSDLMRLRFCKRLVLLTDLAENIQFFVFTPDKWVPVSTAGCVLRLRMEEGPPDVDNSYYYIK
jgi:hypothetical protein